MRVCTACATNTDESGRFCPECGAVLVDDTAATSLLAPAAVTSVLPETSEASSLAETARKSLVGKTIDGFVVEAILGGGSFGTVYRGRQLGLDRPVAIKVPTAEIASDPVMAKRFAREARAAARVTHPGVVAIYAVGEIADGRPYLAMQLIDGEPLDRILETGPVPPLRALKIARLIASALSETHATDVVHRDLKPTNIVWRRDRNGDDRITLVDFGIAVCKPGNADATRLTSGGLIGTPHYMSPEQAHGEVVDHRADLYALGCILFELVTSKPPFEGSGFEVLLAHLGRPIPAPSDRNPELPEAIDNLCVHLMAKKPEDRPRSADELVELIDEALSRLERGSRTPDATHRAPRAKRRTAQPTLDELPAPRRQRASRWIVLGGAAVVVLGVVGLAAFKLSRNANVAIAGGESGGDDSTDSVDPTQPSVATGHRTVVADDGELTTRVTLHDPIVAGTPVSTVIELWNPIGGPLEADHVVITVEDPHGAATGMTASPAKKSKGKYAFRHIFPVPGRYVVRVFPPEAASVFMIDVDVVSK
ncbi:MAG: protein kinase [Deltaproteobacteria bacterium]|nr:protein kinase [Deltaproteobacteria bacterium]